MTTAYSDGPGIFPSPDAPLTVDRPTPPPDIPADRIPYSYAPAVDASATAIGQAHQALDAVADQFEKYIGKIDTSRYSESGLHREIARFADTDAGRSIDAAVTLATDRRDAAKAAIDGVLAELSPDGDTAAELRATRYWDRTRRVLANVKDSGLILAAEKLIDGAKPDQLGTLIQELGPYMESRGVPSDAALKVVFYRKLPEYRAAHEALIQAEKARTVIEANAKNLRGLITGTRAPAGYRRPIPVDARKYDPDRS